MVPTAPIPVGEFSYYVKQMHLKDEHSFAVELKACDYIIRICTMECRDLLYTRIFTLCNSAAITHDVFILQSIPIQTSESVGVGKSNTLKNRYKNIFPCKHMQ